MTGHELKIERVKRNLKQIELARRTGIPRERLSRFENGWEALRAEELQHIREVLNQTAERAGQPTVMDFTTEVDSSTLQTLCPKEGER